MDFYVRKDDFWIIYYLFIYYPVFCASYNGRSVTCGVSKWSWWDTREGIMPRAHPRAGKCCCVGMGPPRQLRRDTWSFLAVLSHPGLPCSDLAPSGWLGTESPDCSFWSTIYTTWMKSRTQRVFPLTPANISPRLPVSDGVSSAAARVVPLLAMAISSPQLLGFFPCFLERAQESTGRKYLSSISPLWPKEKPRKAGSPGLSNATSPLPRFCVKELNYEVAKFSRGDKGGPFEGPRCVHLCGLVDSRWSKEKLSMGSFWLHILLKH